MSATASSRAFRPRLPGSNSAALGEVQTLKREHQAPPPVVQSPPAAAVAQLVASPPPGTVVDVPVEELVANPANARRIVSVKALDALVSKLTEHGQLSAALIFYDEKSRPTLIDGHRRVAGAKQLGWTTVRCEVRPQPRSVAELYLHSRSANAQHETQTPLDDALVWTELLEKGVFDSQASLARAVGVQESDVSRTLSLFTLPKTVMLLLVERPHLLTLRMLSAIRGYCQEHGEDAGQKLVIEVDQEGLSARQVEKRKQAVAAPATRPRADRHAFTWSGVNGEVRRFDKDGRIELTIKRLSPDALQSLEEALLKALAPQAAIPS